MADKYDDAIAYLAAHPEQIYNGDGGGAWGNPTSYKGGCLFDYAGRPDKDGYTWCGCLTQIRRMTEQAETDELTEEIRSDSRIPTRPEDITVADLPVFAEWQRRLDREIRGRS